VAFLRRVVHVLFYLGFLCALVEAVAFLLARLPNTRTGLFSGRAAFVDQMRGQEELYRQFVAARYDGVLGWDNPKATTRVAPDCAGGTVTETYLEDRSRRTPAVAAGPSILTFGDSFTLGAEVADDTSYPAQLSRLLGRKVINQGVGGYDALQAVLKFERMTADYPEARTAVLGVMYDDIFRVLNSYRPAYVLHTGGMFAFKPYMRGAVQMGNPNGPEPAPFATVLARAQQAFRDDYWALPEPRFPYTFALFDALTRAPVWLRPLQKVDFPRIFRLKDFHRSLQAVLERFVASARAAGMAPVILFIPDESSHRDVFDELIQELRAGFRERAVVAAVHDERYRWDEYLPHRHCHPSAYGYHVIAEHAARSVHEAETRVLPQRSR
jgi:hypothetical protein